MPLTDFQKGYLAGLLDGEGTLVISKGKEKRSRLGYSFGCHVKISNTNIELLNNINQICLGKIYCQSKKNEVYNWCLMDKVKIVDLLEQLLPHLIIKKDRAEKMIEFCKSRINRPSFKSGYTLSELNIANNWKEIPTNSGKGYAS